jgi:pimeloyl-ACP methyl ester carboxylesterase
MTAAPDRNSLFLHHQVTGDGTPVVLTHGWLNTGDDWAGVVTELDGAVRALSWDLRGHGRSHAAPAGRYGRDHVLSDLDRMVDLAGVPAVLVGHSLGGYLSLAYAITRPERVAGLVLVAAGPGFRSRTSLEQWNEAVLAMAGRADIPEGQEEITLHVDSMVMDRLGEITVPVATVVGERDRRFLASADVFDKYLDVRNRVIVPETGHMVHVKAPVVVADAIRLVQSSTAGSGGGPE